MWGNAKWRKIGLVAAISLIVAALSWEGHELYEASGERHAGYNYQPASKPGFRISASTKTPTPGYKPSCNNPYNREDADLCAQWAAVEQTSETNRLASLAVQISVFALLFTVIGTGLLVWTFWETRETARRELRAYIAVEGEHLRVDAATGSAEAELRIVNNGKTPAFNTHWGGNIVLNTVEEMERYLATCRATKAQVPDEWPVATVHGGAHTLGFIASDSPLNTKQLKRTMVGEGLNLFVFGTVWYGDAFGNPRYTNFCIRMDKVAAANNSAGDRHYEITAFHNDSD